MANPFSVYARPVRLGGPDPHKANEDRRQDEELELKRRSFEFKKQQSLSAQKDRREAIDLRTRAATLKGSSNPAVVKKQLADQSQRSDLGTIEKQLGRVNQLYEKNFKGVGPGSLLEYLPTPARGEFDVSNQMLSTMIKPLIRGPGEGAWTDADQVRLDSLTLNGGRQDSENEESLRGIRALIQGRKEKHGATDKGWSVKRIK